ncbi:hypothetical protein [Streptomyces arenae]|uniref:hypothetical protein n=1 Tax=Streptomyces arenae TaxID=29301 RepID=UPI002657F249|nr:hypothetical protein [Streptomyces arenae]MCG7204143.1 hypothetical protein [Streptomyces arenae]
MTTQTAPAADSIPQAQGTHHWILTLEKPGRFSVTQEGTFTPPPGSTRQDVYHFIYRSVTEQDANLRGASVGYFELASNQL